ncbi:MAG TPA: hypothetical protein DCY55_09920 [Gammaproteobacteria bacterium]|nr:hypothetical protein [Gammaproteobacteria bacterium]
MILILSMLDQPISKVSHRLSAEENNLSKPMYYSLRHPQPWGSIASRTKATIGFFIQHLFNNFYLLTAIDAAIDRG